MPGNGDARWSGSSGSSGPAAHQQPWPRSLPGHAVRRIVERAAVEREATAADAAVQLVPQPPHALDPVLQFPAPLPGQPLPITSRRCAVGGEGLQRIPDFRQAETQCPGDADDGDPAQDGPVEHTLVAGPPFRIDQSLFLVKPESRRGDATALGSLADGEIGRWQGHLGRCCPGLDFKFT